MPDLDGEDESQSPEQALSDEEPVGTPDAEELLLSDIGDGPEEVGLDAETEGDARAEALGSELWDGEEADEGGEPWTLDERGLDDELEFEFEEDEHGWTEDSEGMGAAFDEEFSLEDETASVDDGGLEGVEDPLLDQLNVDEDDDSLLSDDHDLEGAEADADDYASELSDAVLGRE